MELSENLRELRQKRGYSQEELAETLDLSRQAIAKWESGLASPDAEHLLALSRALRVSVDRLLVKPALCERLSDAGGRDDWDKIASFLQRASAATYAGYGKEEVMPSRPASHDLRYTEAPYLYIDTYLGGERFGGEEAVFENGRGIWLMNYCGRVLSDGFRGDFLKEALSRRPLDIPFRGPRVYRHDDLSYLNRVTGDIEWFVGEEEILLGDALVYECRYHGGIVKQA